MPCIHLVLHVHTCITCSSQKKPSHYSHKLNHYSQKLPIVFTHQTLAKYAATTESLGIHIHRKCLEEMPCTALFGVYLGVPTLYGYQWSNGFSLSKNLLRAEVLIRDGASIYAVRIH